MRFEPMLFHRLRCALHALPVVAVCWGLHAPAARAQSVPPAPVEAAAAESDSAGVAHHRRALVLYEAGEYALALIEFERAYQLTRSHKTLYNIAQVHAQLNQYALARQAFERYLALGGSEVPPARREQVAKELEQLALRTAQIELHLAPADSELSINGITRTAAGAQPLLVDAGHLRIAVSKPGFVTETREIVLAGGDHPRLDIQLTQVQKQPMPVLALANPPASPIPTAAVVGWVATGVLAAGTAAFGIAALSSARSYENQRLAPLTGAPGPARAQLDDARASVRTLTLLTDVFGALALCAGGVSLYLTLADRGGPAAPRAPKSRAAGVRWRGANVHFEMEF